MIPLINPHRLAPTGQWYSYENTNSSSIPTNSNTSRITYDTGTTFKNFKMKWTISYSYGGGNWNGSLGTYVCNLDKGMYYGTESDRPDRFIGCQFHRHNNGNTENEHASHDNALQLTGSCNYTGSVGDERNPYNILDFGCSGGINSGANQELERDGNTMYLRTYGNGFNNSHTSETSWTSEDSNGTGVGEMRYFIIAGRWNGSISATVSYRKFEWFA